MQKVEETITTPIDAASRYTALSQATVDATPLAKAMPEFRVLGRVHLVHLVEGATTLHNNVKNAARERRAPSSRRSPSAGPIA